MAEYIIDNRLLRSDLHQFWHVVFTRHNNFYKAIRSLKRMLCKIYKTRLHVGLSVIYRSPLLTSFVNLFLFCSSNYKNVIVIEVISRFGTLV